MLTAPAFVKRFRELHERAKAGNLSEGERHEYVQSRSQLGRLMLVAQNAGPGGRTLRHQLRIAHLLKVEIDFGGEQPARTSTVDLAGGGFAVLLPVTYRVGIKCSFTLHLPSFGSGTKPVKGQARVASSRLQGAAHRLSFAFEELAPADREHLEMVIIDSVLARFPE